MKALALVVLTGILCAHTARSIAQNEIVYSVDASPTHSQLFVAGPNGENEKPLLPLTGMDYSPSLSADGKWVVFTSERYGSADIFRVHLDGTGLERLTDNPAFDDQGVLSPDGKTLAFVSSRGTGRAHVWLMDVATHKSHILTPNSGSDFHPSWSPDGKWIAFSSDRNSLPIHLPGRWEKLQSLSIYVVRPDGTGLRRLSRGRGVAGSPQWSPDGKQIYYYECTEVDIWYATHRLADKGATQIMSVDVAEGMYKQHTTGNGVRRCPMPLADGSIGCLLTGDKYRISLCRIKDGKTEIGPEGNIRSPYWSRDGKTVVYNKFIDPTDIEVLPGFSHQSGIKLTRLAGGAMMPSPTADRTHMIMTSFVPDTFNSIITMARDGSARKTILAGKEAQGYQFGPAYSPDGTKIAFCVGLGFFRPGDHPLDQIGIMNADGTGIKYSGAPDSQSVFPTWSPDSSSIVYGQDGHLVVWNLATDTHRNLTAPGAQRDVLPKWSPNGDWIAFFSDREQDEQYYVYLIHPDGTGLHRLTNHSGDGHQAWSPDGNWLVFSSARMGWKDESMYSESPQPYGQLFIIRPDGTGLRQLNDDKWESGTALWLR